MPCKGCAERARKFRELWNKMVNGDKKHTKEQIDVVFLQQRGGDYNSADTKDRGSFD